jgi:hypothetical protein
MVHRDIKPANLLLHRNGTVKILDLGLAMFFTDQRSDNVTAKPEATVMGTVDYLSPEQSVNSEAVDIRADIYSLGATLYYLLTGRPPFTEGSTTQKLLWIHMKEPTPVRELRPQVPEGLAAVLRKMMAKEPGERYQTPAEVVAALEPWANKPVAPLTDEELPRSGNTKVVLNRARTAVIPHGKEAEASGRIQARLLRATKNPIFWLGVGGAGLGGLLLLIAIIVVVWPTKKPPPSDGTGTDKGPVAKLRAEPIASFPFDGDTASVKGKVKPLTLKGGGKPFGLGRNRMALALDGKQQFAESEGPLIDTTRPYSVSAWANWTGQKGYQSVLSQDGSAVSGFFLQLRDDNGHYNLAVTPSDAPGNPVRADCFIPAAPNTWQHLVGVYTGTHLKIYLNGARGGVATFDRAWPAKGPFVVGAAKWEGKRCDFFSGRIDDVKVFDFALSDDEVRELYTSEGGKLPSLPEGWIAADVGNPKLAGRTEVEPGGNYVIRGAGKDIWDVSDQCHYVSTAWRGDGMIVARAMGTAVNQDGTGPHEWCKAGVMFRDSTDANAASASVLVTPQHGVLFTCRLTPGAKAEQQSAGGVGTPCWIALMRKGDTFTGYYANTPNPPTAAEWKTVGQPKNIRFTNPENRAGVAITSHNVDMISFINLAGVAVRKLAANTP